MRLCVFSDVHGNRVFFEAFLNACIPMKFDRFYFLGDAVGYFLEANAVIDRLREIGAFCIEGNHDSVIRGEFPISVLKREPIYQLQKTLDGLTPENLAYIRSWPDIRRETIDGKRIEFVHGSPDNHLKEYGYEDSRMAEYDRTDLDVLFIGHTHRPWMRQNCHTLVINAGSVGLPRDDGCIPSFAAYDTESGKAEIHRIVVDAAPIFAHKEGLHPDVIECLKRKAGD